MFSGHPNIRNALYLQPPHHPCGGFFVGVQNPGGAWNSAWILSPGRNGGKTSGAAAQTAAQTAAQMGSKR